MLFTQVLSYVLIIIVGSVLALLKMPILLWPGLFLIFFANGAGRLPGLSSPHFRMETSIICQDRLGTNLSNAQEQRFFGDRLHLRHHDEAHGQHVQGGHRHGAIPPDRPIGLALRWRHRLSHGRKHLGVLSAIALRRQAWGARLAVPTPTKISVKKLTPPTPP